MNSILSLAGLLERSASEAVGFGLGTALGRALEPEATRLAQESWSIDPSLALDPQTAAVLVRLGRIDAGTGAGAAAQWGVNGDHFARLVEATRLPPGTGELVELNRRGMLGDAELVDWLERAGVDERLAARIAELKRVHLAPADAAMARQQGFLTPAEQYAYAALGGYSNADAELQYEISGLPPGLGVGLDLLRRGEIDEARLTQYVIEGHTKPKYLADILKYRRTILSPAVYAEALIRNRISEPEAIAGAAMAGLTREDFLLWSHMMGRPPGIGEALTLVNRNVPFPRDSAEALAWFTDVVARSDVRTEYAPALFHLRVRYPSLFQMRALISNNSITDAYAKQLLLEEGYPAQLVDGIVLAAHRTKSAANKDLSLSVIETAYDAGLETHTQALAAIESLGYDPAESEILLGLHEARRILAELSHGVTIVRGRYTGWKIDEATARAELVTLQLSPAAIDQRMVWWNAEREANRPTLTQAEIVAGFHYNRYTYDEALQLLLSLGWREEHALTLLWNRAHGDPRPTA